MVAGVHDFRSRIILYRWVGQPAATGLNVKCIRKPGHAWPNHRFNHAAAAGSAPQQQAPRFSAETNRRLSPKRADGIDQTLLKTISGPLQANIDVRIDAGDSLDARCDK